MATKKTFKNNPALQFITESPTEIEEDRAPAPAPREVKETREIRRPRFDEPSRPPKGYKINPEYYVETKSRRVQVVMQPSLYDRVKAAAKKHGISVNEYIHRVLDAATEDVKK